MDDNRNPSRPATHDDLRRALNRQTWQIAIMFAIMLLAVAPLIFVAAND